MSDPFATGGSSGVKFTDFEDKLLLIYGTEYLDGDQKMETKYGKKDVVVADVIVLDGDNTEEHSGVYVFQGGLVGTLKRHVGKRPYLGVLGKKDAKDKNFQKAWAFLDPNDEQKAEAREFIKAREAAAEDPFAV